MSAHNHPAPRECGHSRFSRRLRRSGAWLLPVALSLSAMQAEAAPTQFSFQGNAFQTWTAPATGWYLLDARGGQGGAASNNSHQGGKGAWMQGYAQLTAGDELRIAVGGAGQTGVGSGGNPSGGGGGGASSIVRVLGGNAYEPLLIVGGGGGAAADYDGSPGLVGEDGGPPNGGTGGNGGGIGEPFRGGAGGAGYLTDGGTHYEGNGTTVLSYGGQAYLSGNYGGDSGAKGGNGGWGGGGEGGPSNSITDGGGGGGGGYSGGGGGANPGDGGGGGGSYRDPSLDTTLAGATADHQSGNGVVTIEAVDGVPTVQQPENQVARIGQPATLGPVFLDSAGQMTYQWLKDGVILVDQTEATLNLPSFQFTDSGGYQAVIHNPLNGAMFITRPAYLSALLSSKLEGWGRNDFAQLGLGDQVGPRIAPVSVTANVVAAATGDSHSLLLKPDGTLWAMGSNSRGQLGITGDLDSCIYQRDNYLCSKAPRQVATDVVAAAAGNHFSLFVKRDGTLWAMGGNAYGELGITGDVDTCSPIEEVGGEIPCLKAPRQVATDVVSIAGGPYTTRFLKRDGSLWGMGSYTPGEPRTPVRLASDVVTVASIRPDVFVKRDGTLWAGITCCPTQVPRQVASDVVAAAGGHEDVTTGHEHVLFVKRDGTLWAWGSNYLGELGIGNTKEQESPVQVASDVAAVEAADERSLFVKRDGTAWAMGNNAYGELGAGISTDYDSHPTPEQIFIRNTDNAPVGPLIVASLAKVYTSSQHNLVVARSALQSGTPAKEYVCHGAPQKFSVEPEPEAVRYLWSLPPEARGSSEGPTIKVRFRKQFQEGGLCVSPLDATGRGTPKCRWLVAAERLPRGRLSVSGPEAPAVTGTYSVAPIEGASTYTWSVPKKSKVRIVSGQGTPSIELQTEPGFKRAQLKVVVSNCKGKGARGSLWLPGPPP